MCSITSAALKKNPDVWKMLFNADNMFTLCADEVLDEINVIHSEAQLKKNAEIDTYKHFCDAIQSIHYGGRCYAVCNLTCFR